MAQRSSRKKSRARSAEKKPELRKSRGPEAATEKAAARAAKQQAGPKRPAGGPRQRIRPEGSRGALVLAFGGWIVVLATAMLGLVLHRWNLYSSIDGLWLYVAIGTLAAAVPVGYIARTTQDVTFWVAQGGLVSLALYVAEVVLGPACAPGAHCGFLSTYDVTGLLSAMLTFAALLVASLWIGGRTFRVVRERRSTGGRTSAITALVSLMLVGLFVGMPLAAILIGIDVAARRAPGLAQQAKVAASDCFALDEPSFAVSVRPDPTARSSAWTTFLVHRTHEDRKLTDGKRATSATFAGDAPTNPYEAVAIYNHTPETGEPGFVVDCRRISPSAGSATKHDTEPLDQATLEANPIKPQPLLQPPTATTPTTAP